MLDTEILLTSAGLRSRRNRHTDGIDHARTMDTSVLEAGNSSHLCCICKVASPGAMS